MGIPHVSLVRSEAEAALGLAWIMPECSRMPLSLLRERRPLEVWGADTRRLCEWSGRREWVARFAERRAAFDLEAALETTRRTGVEFIPWGDPRYPDALCELPQPPAGLFLRGRPGTWDALLTSPRITIVGTRKPTSYALAAGAALTEAFARAGVVVLSGMAYGVDGRVHEVALASDGLTAAVLGTGPDVVYPHRHRSLMKRILAHGVVASEFPPGTRASRWNFPQRNRILAALGDATVVVQAGTKSGALVTAGHALDLHREVFAVPGSMFVEAHRGVHLLIQDGAAICIGVRQTVEDFFSATRSSRVGRERSEAGVRRGVDTQASSAAVGLVMLSLGQGPRSVDDVARVTGLEIREVARTLALLEIRGEVQRIVPGLFGLGP